jgi:uncharacterized RDD family membrane protein YckC
LPDDIIAGLLAKVQVLESEEKQKMSYPGYQPQPPPPGYGAPMGAAYASIGKRILAYIIDGFIVGLGTIPGFILMFVGVGLAASTADSRGQLSDDAAAGAVGIFLLAYVLIFAGVIALWLYNCYLLGRDGATIGKRLMKIKVLDAQGQPLGFGKAFLREIVKWALGSCFILLLWPLWDEQKQGLQDKMFGTHVFDA